MTKMIRIMLVAALALGGSLAGGGAATAQVATAQQEDVDNEAEVEQNGSATTGDAVAGQVVGIVSSGDASVDARNHSEDVDVETGVAESLNSAQGAFVGMDGGGDQFDVDNELDIEQTANASSGDGVGGQVIGVVTSAGGSADVVAANTSLDIDIETGAALASNSADEPFVGLLGFATQTDVDNELDIDQTADAATGDGVGGQVIGVVSAGDASVDARNHSEDVDIETGDAEALNSAFEAFVGVAGFGTQTDVDNEADISQTANAASGDAVGGQVVGVVTSAGGSADAVLDNTSLDIDAESGFSLHENNADGLFVGLALFI